MWKLHQHRTSISLAHLLKPVHAPLLLVREVQQLDSRLSVSQSVSGLLSPLHSTLLPVIFVDTAVVQGRPHEKKDLLVSPNIARRPIDQYLAV